MENFKKLKGLIELMNNSSQKLIGIMEEQIDAIIGADAYKIEALSEVYSSESWNYKNYEDDFIHSLNEILHAGNPEENRPRLIDLKNHFPEMEDDIEKWHNQLSGNAQKLQNKHAQIIQLLEFAMKQNARLMHALYNKHNE